MLIKLAWRNIWRNKRRSLVVLLSVIVGVNALLFMDGLTNGMIYQMLFNQLSSNVSHIQIHKSGFNDNKIVQSNLPNPEKVISVLEENPSVKAISKRAITFGLLSSASNSAGVFINGIIPDDEMKISSIHESIIDGKYLGDEEREIVIGSKLAKKLEVEVGDKVVGLANTPDGTIGSDVFRISGIYKTASSAFDKLFIYIPLQTVQKMLDIGTNIHEIAVITEDYRQAPIVKEQVLSNLNENYEVLSYKDLLPLLIMYMDIYKESLFFINFIIGLALIFGIINSMLMAVFERIQEFGVLMSIGMKNSKLFLMIVYEAFTIGVLGTILGLASGMLLIWPFSEYGIDFSLFSEGLNSFGVGAIIYPVLSVENFIITLLMIPFISVLGAFYPAYKAIKLDPIYALRHV